MPWPFTRKKNKNTRNLFTKSNNNLRRMAANKAYYTVKSKFGRAGQSRVANLIRPSESGLKHNVVASEMQLKGEEFYNEYKEQALEQAKQAAVGIDASQIEEIRAFGESLRRQIGEAAESARPTITITIPRLLARLIVFIIGAGLVFFMLFLAPVLFMMDPVQYGLMLESAFNFMIWRETAPTTRPPAGTVMVNNPMRRGENV